MDGLSWMEAELVLALAVAALIGIILRAYRKKRKAGPAEEEQDNYWI